MSAEFSKIQKSSHVQSVARSLIMIDTLSEINREISLTELSLRLGWPKSTVHGLLSTLRDYHYIDQSPTTGHYKLGVRFFEIGNQVARSWDVSAVALPHMQRLNNRLGEMIQLATEDHGEVLHLQKVDSSHMMRIVSDIGGRQPMHCTSLGKVLLAYKPANEARSILKHKGMARLTAKTITTQPQLERELERVRAQGYAVDDREVMEGLRCVAAPIFDKDNQVKYAISVSGLYNNMQGERLDEIIALVKQCGTDISHAMGYRRQA